jgi:hypothetical protein
MIRNQISLAELEASDPHASKVGSERRFLCPLCGFDKPKDAAHRSLSVNTETGAWMCHRCAEKGIVDEFRSQNAGGMGATRKLGALKTNSAFCVPPPRPLGTQVVSNTSDTSKDAWLQQLKGRDNLVGTSGAEYLVKRGIDVELAHKSGVRFAPQFYGRPAVVFPIIDQTGKSVAVQGRFIDGKENPKVQTAGPKKLGIFATPRAVQNSVITITEAPIDALTLAQCNIPSIALCGKDGFSNCLLEICAFRPVRIAFDADEAGDSGAEKLASVLLKNGSTVMRLRPVGAKDFNEVLTTSGSYALCEMLARTVQP